MSQSPAQYDLITIGDSTIDTFIRIHDATIECDLDKKNCKICIPYGSKVPVDAIAYGIAGNAANVAVGASRLGMNTAIYSNLGNDDQGKRIRDEFLKNGVSEEYVVTSQDKHSNLSVVLTFQGERTIFVYHQDWFYSLPKLKPASWIYLTSMAQTFTNSTIMDDVCKYADKAGAKLVYAPGTYQLKADVKRFPKVLERCDLMIVNMEEALKILGIDVSSFPQIRDILNKLILLGPKMAVITDGAEGSYATDGEQFLKAGIVKTPVYEKTGAGDAYSAALIAALDSGLDLKEAMAWGTINAAWTISVISTQRGLLTKSEISAKRKELSSFKVGSL